MLYSKGVIAVPCTVLAGTHTYAGQFTNNNNNNNKVIIIIVIILLVTYMSMHHYSITQHKKYSSQTNKNKKMIFEVLTYQHPQCPDNIHISG